MYSFGDKLNSELAFELDEKSIWEIPSYIDSIGESGYCCELEDHGIAGSKVGTERKGRTWHGGVDEL